MPETAPGRYEATVRPEVESGALSFAATFTAAGAPVADATGRLTLPLAPELMPVPAGDQRGVTALAAAAAASGGRVLTDQPKRRGPRPAGASPPAPAAPCAAPFCWPPCCSTSPTSPSAASASPPRPIDSRR